MFNQNKVCVERVWGKNIVVAENVGWTILADESTWYFVTTFVFPKEIVSMTIQEGKIT